MENTIRFHKWLIETIDNNGQCNYISIICRLDLLANLSQFVRSTVYWRDCLQYRIRNARLTSIPCCSKAITYIFDVVLFVMRNESWFWNGASSSMDIQFQTEFRITQEPIIGYRSPWLTLSMLRTMVASIPGRSSTEEILGFSILLGNLNR